VLDTSFGGEVAAAVWRTDCRGGTLVRVARTNTGASFVSKGFYDAKTVSSAQNAL